MVTFVTIKTDKTRKKDTVYIYMYKKYIIYMILTILYKYYRNITEEIWRKYEKKIEL